MGATEQRSASLEPDARQPRLVIEVDVTTDTKTHKRTEVAAAAERVMSGDNSSAEVDPDPICLASFDEDYTGSPAHPCKRDDALVDNGAAALKPCFSLVEMRTLTAAGCLLPAGKVSTATRIPYYQPRLRFYPIEAMNSERTPIQYTSYYSSFRRMNNPLPLFWRGGIEAKSRQTLGFDPSGSTGRLRACLFLGTWRALLFGEHFVGAPAGGDLEHFLVE